MASLVSSAFSRPALPLARQALAAAAKATASSRFLSTLLTPVSSQSILLDDTAEPALWQCLPEWCKEQKKYNQVFVLGESATWGPETGSRTGKPMAPGSFASAIQRRRRRFLVYQDSFWGR
eukprot:765253-Hanusia_phi.AAC.1